GSLRLFKGERELGQSEQPLYRAARSGETVPGFEGQLMRLDGGRVAVRLSATSLFTERGAAEWHRRIRVDEQQHRVKNTITAIGALPTRMVKGSLSRPEFTDAFL